jgi:AcrR family transcriptional regulator
METLIETKNVGRRERKRERTKRQIQDVAMRLFSEKGFDNVTVAEIAEKADVDVTTFWRHFGSKYVVLFADREAWLQELKVILSEISNDLPPYEAVLAGLSAASSSVVRPEFQELRDELLKQNPSMEVRAAVLTFEDMVRQVIEENLASRMGLDPASDPRPFMLAGVIMTAVRWLRAHSASYSNEKSMSDGLKSLVQNVVSDIQ